MDEREKKARELGWTSVNARVFINGKWESIVTWYDPNGFAHPQSVLEALESSEFPENFEIRAKE